jgi:hypothetical protein
MTQRVWLNCQCWLAHFDLSGAMNAPALEISTETPEDTGKGCIAKTRLPGLTDISAAVNGYFDGSLDGAVFDRLGLIDSALTMTPGNADYERAFFFKPAMAKYSPGGKIGDVFAFKVEGKGNGRLIRGNILVPKLARIVSNHGVARQLGAVAAGKKMYAVLHVFAASVGDTLDVALESDVSANFLTINRIAATQGVGFSINDAGTGYAPGDVITVVQSGGSGGTLTVATISGGGGTGPVATLALTTPGTGYAVANGLATTVSPAGGTGFKLNILALTDTPVINFAQKTAVGHEWAEIAGPFTDSYWRIKWAIGGVDPNFSFAVVVGIL